MRALLILLSLFLLQCTGAALAPPSPGLAARVPSSSPVVDKSGYRYDPSDRSCDGLPRLQVQTMPGTCLGLVLPQSRAVDAKKLWRMPRTIQQVPGTEDFLVVDMGGWGTRRGGIYLLRRGGGGQYENSLLKIGLNMPHALKWGPGGYFYIGETDKVSRFHFVGGQIRDWQTVVPKLPRFSGYMHPLVSLAFDPRNDDMYINSGAPSDHCSVKIGGGYATCPEDAEMGLAAIYRVPGDALHHLPAGGIPHYELAAQGLRNSMAMEVHPSGMLVQGENGRDFPQLEEPFEEINAIDLRDSLRGKHYGWPYCYDFHAVSPEWKFSQNRGDALHQRFTAPVDCGAVSADGPGQYQPPYILMPPHAAPLQLGYYNSGGQLASLLKGKMLVTWHGHELTGHRFVAYTVDERGLPKLAPTVSGKETYSVDVKGACPTQAPFRPEGGLDRFAPYTEVISQWDEVKGVRPKGSPVGYTVADDGSIFLVEDKNRDVVRLAASPDALESQCGSEIQKRNAPDPRIELLAWRSFMELNPVAKARFIKVRDKVIKKYCTSCHGSFVVKDIATDQYSQLDFLVKNEFFVAHNSMASKFYQALAHTGEVPAMPPADVPFPPGAAGQSLVNLVKTWIDSLPEDLARSYKRTTMKEARKIRLSTRPGDPDCGQLSAGDSVYFDPRAETQIRQDGWVWSRVYLVPGDTRLFKGACPYPVDGTFRVALLKK